MPIRIDVEALEAAKIAAAFKGMTVMDYASKVLLEAANKDIEECYRLRSEGPRLKPRKPKGSD
jgi:hypothetical protein